MTLFVNELWKTPWVEGSKSLNRMLDVIEVIRGDDPFSSLPRLEYEVGTKDVRLVLLPPHEIDAKFLLERHVIHVNLSSIKHKIGVNSDALKEMTAPSDSLCFWPRKTSVSLKSSNRVPGCLLEVSDEMMTQWYEDGEISHGERNKHCSYYKDPAAAAVGRAAISYMMDVAGGRTLTDPLTTEALGLCIAMRLLAGIRVRNRSGSVDDEIATWTKKMEHKRVERAFEWIDAHVSDPTLSISGVAAAVKLSTCYFSAIFKASTGKTPYGYILARRAKLARDLIIGTRQPLAEIAYQAGFSSQAHMTTLVKRYYGVTPGIMRTE